MTDAQMDETREMGKVFVEVIRILSGVVGYRLEQIDEKLARLIELEERKEKRDGD